MKNIIITVLAAVIIQVSTCGNQKSYSSSRGDGGYTMVLDLYRQYKEKHNDIEQLEDNYKHLLSEKSGVLKDWNQYNQFSKSYWKQVDSYINGFDSTDQKELRAFFKNKEHKYEVTTAKLSAQKLKIGERIVDLNQKMDFLKLIASHKQMETYLSTNKPELDELTAYLKSVESVISNTNVKSKNMLNGASVAKILD
jgi:cell division protein FtsB